MQSGQIGPLLLLGAVLFLECERRGWHFAVGAASTGVTEASGAIDGITVGATGMARAGDDPAAIRAAGAFAGGAAATAAQPARAPTMTIVKRTVRIGRITVS